MYKETRDKYKIRLLSTSVPLIYYGRNVGKLFTTGSSRCRILLLLQARPVRPLGSCLILVSVTLDRNVSSDISM
jgi:hypothetical protein